MCVCVCVYDEMSVSSYLCKHPGLLRDGAPSVIYYYHMSCVSFLSGISGLPFDSPVPVLSCSFASSQLFTCCVLMHIQVNKDSRTLGLHTS